MTELCARYGVSRRVGYKWQARYQDDGAAGLVDQSRRPRGSPRGLHERPAYAGRARLGDAPAVLALARARLARHQPEVGHHLGRVLGAARVAERDHEGRRGDRADAGRGHRPARAHVRGAGRPEPAVAGLDPVVERAHIGA